MTRHAVQCLVLVALFGAATWQAPADEPKKEDVKKEAIKKELEKLEGTWTVVSLEAKGKARAVDELKDLQLTIKGDQWTLKFANGTQTATIKIDPTKDPKT